MKAKLLLTLIITLVLASACVNSSTSPSPKHIASVPDTSASAITSPPPNMEGINTHTQVFGTGADPNMITLGPKVGGQPGWQPYPNKFGVKFELNHGTPVLAPIDMVLIGFRNNNANYRIQSGQKRSPYNDLLLCFESADSDWPDMIISIYHLLSSPLLLGHNQNPDCSEIEEWGSTVQAQGHLFYDTNDYVILKNENADSCNALIGRLVKRGDLIGYAGSVGNHSMVSFCFKVSHKIKNPTVQKGNPYLHWVQPESFFYWRCYNSYSNFPSGVLAYPFECEGYQLPLEQNDVNFKYNSLK